MEAGDTSVAQRLGEAYLAGEGGPAAPEKAVELLCAAARNGDAEAKLRVAGLYLAGPAGLRDRREGLAFRLSRKDTGGVWRPKKRVTAGDRVPERRGKVYLLRQEIARTTHAAFEDARQRASLDGFMEAILPLTDAYDAFYRPGLVERLKQLPERVVRKVLRQLTRRTS